MSEVCWLKGIATGGRWLGIKSKIERLSEFCKVEIIYISVENRWLRQTVFYEIEGFEGDIATFKKLLKSTYLRHD